MLRAFDDAFHSFKERLRFPLPIEIVQPPSSPPSAGIPREHNTPFLSLKYYVYFTPP